MKRCDVIVVGGGPAGSTCAWRLGAAGLDVIVLDRAKFPRNKLCAGWITPQVVEDLELDLDAYPLSLMTFPRLCFHWKGLAFSKKTVQHSIRRVEFDDYLLQRSGATVVQHNVRQVERQRDGFIVDDEYRCRYLIGAGGTACPVYKALFHDANPRAKTLQIATLELEFAHALQIEDCHLWFFEDGLPGYAWYVPKARGHINIGLGGAAGKLKAGGAQLKSLWRKFLRRLECGGFVSDVQVKPGGYSYYLRGNVQRARIGNAMLVGDSLGLASNDMGEGIGPAVQSALRAAAAICGGRDYNPAGLERYTLPQPAGLYLRYRY